MKELEKATIEEIWKGKDILFTFKSEAQEFLTKWEYEFEYDDGHLIDDEHFNIKGYKSKIYWIAQ